MRYRWRSQHAMIDGRRLKFTGSALSLFGHWLKWWLLCIITIGIYGFWVASQLAEMDYRAPDLRVMARQQSIFPPLAAETRTRASRQGHGRS